VPRAERHDGVTASAEAIAGGPRACPRPGGSHPRTASPSSTSRSPWWPPARRPSGGSGQGPAAARGRRPGLRTGPTRLEERQVHQVLRVVEGGEDYPLAGPDRRSPGRDPHARDHVCVAGVAAAQDARDLVVADALHLPERDPDTLGRCGVIGAVATARFGNSPAVCGQVDRLTSTSSAAMAARAGIGDDDALGVHAGVIRGRQGRKRPESGV
jgi:hypothetical protein